MDREISQAGFLIPLFAFTLGSFERLQVIVCCAKWALHDSERRVDAYLLEARIERFANFPHGVFECAIGSGLFLGLQNKKIKKKFFFLLFCFVLKLGAFRTYLEQLI